MPLNIRDRDASRRIETVDEVDLDPFDQSPVRAILLPDSESAVYSTHLQDNNPQVSRIIPSVPLSSSSDVSSSEDERTILSPETTSKENTSIVKQRRNRIQFAIILKQSRDKERFTFGASLDSDVVLKHPDPTDHEWCYINLLHAQLYPNPDHDALEIYNSSTSTFVVKPLNTSQVGKNIITGQQARLDCGSWRLTLGKGLDFQIRIIPRIHRETYHGWKLISPSISSLRAKPSRKEAVLRLPNKEIHKTLTMSAPKSEETSIRNKNLKSRYGGEIAAVGPQDSGLLTKCRSMGESPPLREIIGESPRTMVFKAIRHEMAVAVKVCRKPEVKSSADSWRNEVRILRRLQHPSVARLIHYDASNLFLELEYVGPDLSKFVDGEKMSQLSTDLQHRIWIDISGGLEYIHAQDIAHLDIKPQNILLSESNRAVLCDFELSVERVVKPVYCDGGTPCYIPPEYLLDEKRGIPGDIWAFGVTMLFVFGLMPLPRGNWKIADICRNEGVHKEMFDWLNKLEQIEESIPEALSLLRQMLERNPTKRITASKLASDLLVMPQIKSVAAELIV